MSESIEEIQRQELARMFGGFARVRMLLLPIMLCIVGWIIFQDPALWRRLSIGVMLVGAPLVAGTELWKIRRLGLQHIRYHRTFAAASIAMFGLSLSTGGMESPFYPSIFPMAFVTWTLFTRTLHRLLFLAFFQTGNWALYFA